MNRSMIRGLIAASMFIWASGAAAAETSPAAAGAGHSRPECEVWARELGFADAVARHDAVAFAEHIDPGAVFGAADAAPTRGRAAITAAWAGLIEGKGVTLHWYPTRTTVGSDGAAEVAWSSGPYLLQMQPPQGEPKRILGTFRSVWRKGADGDWHVIYDAGGEDRRPATPDDIETFHKGRREVCPAA